MTVSLFESDLLIFDNSFKVLGPNVLNMNRPPKFKDFLILDKESKMKVIDAAKQRNIVRNLLTEEKH